MKYQEPRSTLHNRVHNGASSTVGRPIILSNEEEAIIVERSISMGTWEFPLTNEDLRELIKFYLDEKGVVIDSFHDNLHGNKFFAWIH